MRFYNGQHRYYCGIDLHAKTMYVCILDASGNVLVHRNLRSEPKAFLDLVAPYRDDLVVAAECTFTWYGLADLCAKERMRPPRARLGVEQDHDQGRNEEREPLPDLRATIGAGHTSGANEVRTTMDAGEEEVDVDDHQVLDRVESR